MLISAHRVDGVPNVRGLVNVLTELDVTMSPADASVKPDSLEKSAWKYVQWVPGEWTVRGNALVNTAGHVLQKTGRANASPVGRATAVKSELAHPANGVQIAIGTASVILLQLICVIHGRVLANVQRVGAARLVNDNVLY